MIDRADWKWYGNAAHFIGGHNCRFHLATEVGDYLVSTVGQYVSPMDGKGYTEIGHKRTFETMVFRIIGHCDEDGCGCGMPEGDGRELDFAPYKDAGAATRGHVKMCEEWAGRND